MGAWAEGPFDNDDAADWLYRLYDDGPAAIAPALHAVSEADEADAANGARAVAAAAVVAGLRSGDWSAGADAELLDWADGRTSLDLDALALDAREALAKVRSHKSELRRLWSESHSEETWLDSLDEVEQRLR